MKNKFFEEMWNTLKAYEEARANGERPEHPYTAGQTEAARSYFYGRSEDETEVTVDSGLWEKDIHDFIDTLRKAGIKSLVGKDHSTALMRMLHGFNDEGCEFKEFCKLEGRQWRGQTEAIPAIRFSL